MTTNIEATTPDLTPITFTKAVCVHCHKPTSDEQGLVRIIDGYEHPACGELVGHHYHQVSQVSFPTDTDTHTDEHCEKCRKQLEPLEVEGGFCWDCLLENAADLADFRDWAGW